MDMSGRIGWRAGWAVLGSLFFFLSDAQAQECGVRALVSGYYSNVHVYDACTGEFLRKLDESGRISGAQAVKLGPDGRLWVVSEEAGTILRYDLDTLDYVDTFATVGASWGVTGLAFTGPDTVYLASYATSALRRYDISTGASHAVPLAGLSALKGPDNGMTTGPDGELLIPGYDSSNVVRFDPGTATYSQLVATGADGLRATRGLLFSEDGTKLYVTGERSNQVLRYNYPSGTLDKVISTGITTPTGIAWYDEDTLLVAGSGTLGSGVLKINAETGAEEALFIRAGTGGLVGPTYVTLVPASSEVFEQPNPATIGGQYWLTALGRLNGTRAELEANTALGSYFGDGFNPADVRKPRWGSITLNFLNCNEADLSWTSRGEDSARFGSGSYRIQRIIGNPNAAACTRTGIAAAPDTTWVQGAWYGGPSRDGEGFMLDSDGTGLIFLTWFTYRPE
jgi:hypothetical protein